MASADQLLNANDQPGSAQSQSGSSVMGSAGKAGADDGSLSSEMFFADDICAAGPFQPVEPMFG